MQEKDPSIERLTTRLYRSKTGTDNEPQALAFKPKKEAIIPPSNASLRCIANMDEKESPARALELTTIVESPTKLSLSLEVGPPSLLPSIAASELRE